MIARLAGTLRLLESDDRVLVDVHGVGYEVHVSRTSFAALPGDGESVSLDVHTNVREDAIQLFGFASREEKSMFLRLVQVSGIGPKVALGVLSGLAPHELASAIARGDIKRLTSIPHVGKKLAERIVVELKDKIGNVVELPTAVKAEAAVRLAGPQEEAISALLNLGYKRPEAEAALADLPKDLTDTSEIIRRALKGLAGRLAR